MSLRAFVLVSSCITAAGLLLLPVLKRIRTAQLPWAEEPGGYHNPRYDVDVLLPDKHNLVLPPQDDLVGFQSPPERHIATCTRWMHNNRAALANRTLLDITMPGTHDSGAFSLTNHIIPGSLPWIWTQLLDVIARAGLGYVVQWAKSQTVDIASQLQHGVRFFDFRAGWNGTHWVTCHAAEGAEMTQLFHDIDAFLNSTTHEMVIAELTHVYNADDDQREELAQMMRDTLGHHIAPCCRLDRPLKDFWEDGRRLVLVSNVECQSSTVVGDSSSEGRCPWWGPQAITNTWADTDLINVLWMYNKELLEMYKLNSTSLLKMSWTLTPHITTLLHGVVHYPSTLLQLADSANVLMPDFFDAQVAEGRTEFPQILISDHFQSAYLVPMTTRINRIAPCLGTDPT